MNHILKSLAVLALAALPACVSGGSPDEKRATIDRESGEILQRLYREEGGARSQVESAAGYGVFSNVSVDVFFVGGGGGYGVVVDNNTKERTYFRVATGSVGFGLGVKDFRAVFVFNDAASLRDFVENGWDAGAEADAAAVASGDKGGELSGATTVRSGTTVYQLTETGLALRANVKGTRYIVSDELNSGRGTGQD